MKKEDLEVGELYYFKPGDGDILVLKYIAEDIYDPKHYCGIFNSIVPLKQYENGRMISYKLTNDCLDVLEKV